MTGTGRCTCTNGGVGDDDVTALLDVDAVGVEAVARGGDGDTGDVDRGAETHH